MSSLYINIYIYTHTYKYIYFYIFNSKVKKLPLPQGLRWKKISRKKRQRGVEWGEPFQGFCILMSWMWPQSASPSLPPTPQPR